MRESTKKSKMTIESDELYFFAICIINLMTNIYNDNNNSIDFLKKRLCYGIGS